MYCPRHPALRWIEGTGDDKGYVASNVTIRSLPEGNSVVNVVYRDLSKHRPDRPFQIVIPARFPAGLHAWDLFKARICRALQIPSQNRAKRKKRYSPSIR